VDKEKSDMWSLFGGKLGVFLLAATLIAVAMAVISRNWSCRKSRPPNIDRRGPYLVIAVETGASLTVAGRLREEEDDAAEGEETNCRSYAGGGQFPVEVALRRSSTVQIAGIQAPPKGETHFEESRRALEIAAGCEVTLLIEGRLMRKEQIAVYGESGICLQESQLRAGMAAIDAVWANNHELPTTWEKAQTAAKQAKRGIWEAQ
jgi:endonuclease YncB( thermonuclease family)